MGDAPLDLAEQLRRCQEGLIEARRAQAQAERARDHAVGRMEEERARAERLDARLAHVTDRAERLQALVDSIRSSSAWRAVEAYRGLIGRLRP